MGDDASKYPRDPREPLLWQSSGSQSGAHLGSPAGGPGAGRFKQTAPQGTATPGAGGNGPSKPGFWDNVYHEAMKAGVRLIVGPSAGLVSDYLLDHYRQNADNVAEACRRALEKYVLGAIEEETGRAIGGLLEGLLQGLIMMMAVVAVTTLVGAGAGAAIGALFFGVGAAPGAAVGAEAGFDAGMWILEWMGIGFLAVYVVSNLGEVVKALGAGVVRAWNAGNQGTTRDRDLDAAAQKIAQAIGILFRLVLEAIVMYLLEEGTAAVARRLPGLVKALSESKLGRGFGEWIQRNYEGLIKDPKVNPKLRESKQGGSAVGERPVEPQGERAPEPVAPKPGSWPTARARQLLKELDDLNQPPKTLEKAHQKRLISEQLGNEAAKSLLRKKLGKDIPDQDFQVFSGAHTVNVMYKDPATGKVYVMEAKGGGSQLGTRVGKYPPNEGMELEQGSPEYLHDVAQTMAHNQNDAAKAQAGRDILNAEQNGDLEYVGVRGDYDKAAPSANPIDPKQIFP